MLKVGRGLKYGAYGIAVCCVGLMLFLLGPASTSSASHVDDEQEHVVITADGSTLSQEAQDWVQNFDQNTEGTWLANGGPDAAADIRAFKEILLGTFLPPASVAVPPQEDQVVEGEVCSPEIHGGCWLLRRDDTDLHSTGEYGCCNWLGWRYQIPSDGAWSGYHVPDLANQRDIVYDDKTSVTFDKSNGSAPCGLLFGDVGGTTSLTSEAEDCYGDGPELHSSHRVVHWKSGFPDIAMHVQADDPEVPNDAGAYWMPWEQDWPERVADALQQPQNAGIREWMAHVIEPYSTLLQRYGPVLKYDTLGRYRADSPATMADNPAVGFVPGNIGLDQPPGLENLGSIYPNSQYAWGWHHLDPLGVDANEHYDDWSAYRAAHVLDTNLTYAHVAHDGDGHTWLQYWLFYYYQDSIAGVGEHEGDWEMVQVRLGPEQEALGATYAQHTTGERCDWSAVETGPDGNRPLVYVARTTHASFLEAGSPHGASDYADGDGQAVTPAVVEITNPLPGWVEWPGAWGGTSGDTSSPVGPRFNSGSTKWNDPGSWSDTVNGCDS